MKKLFAVSLAVALALTLGLGTASAQSAKATAAVDELITISVATGPVNLADATEVGNLPWLSILSQDIRTANNKDLFIDASLECGLYTKTRVKTKGGAEDTETADAGVRVRVVIDLGTDDQRFASPDHGVLLGGGTEASTGAGVSFCRRVQTLSAKLQGILTCLPGFPIPPECLTEEEIELVLSTLNANSFNFIAVDLSSGWHTIDVQAVGIAHASSADSEAIAYVGAGSVTIEEVRMIRGETIEF